jgi:hypothetical protein
VRSHSTIRRYLRAQIGHVTFRLFFWGRCNNSQPSRLAASNRLIARLDKTFERSPKAHHFVIAHSHGGNVALYALENEIVRERLSGIVCIATPFLEAKPRLMLPLTKILVAVLACSWILVPFTIALSIAGSWRPVYPQSPDAAPTKVDVQRIREVIRAHAGAQAPTSTKGTVGCSGSVYADRLLSIQVRIAGGHNGRISSGSVFCLVSAAGFVV